MIVVSNSSPPIALAQIKQLSILPQLYGEILIPSVTPLLTQLLSFGFRMDTALFLKAQALEGES